MEDTPAQQTHTDGDRPEVTKKPSNSAIDELRFSATRIKRVPTVDDILHMADNEEQAAAAVGEGAAGDGAAASDRAHGASPSGASSDARAAMLHRKSCEVLVDNTSLLPVGVSDEQGDIVLEAEHIRVCEECKGKVEARVLSVPDGSVPLTAKQRLKLEKKQAKKDREEQKKLEKHIKKQSKKKEKTKVVAGVEVVQAEPSPEMEELADSPEQEHRDDSAPVIAPEPKKKISKRGALAGGIGSGAVVGGIAGAALGSVFGPMGMAAGAAAGAAMGGGGGALVGSKLHGRMNKQKKCAKCKRKFKKHVPGSQAFVCRGCGVMMCDTCTRFRYIPTECVFEEIQFPVADKQKFTASTDEVLGGSTEEDSCEETPVPTAHTKEYVHENDKFKVSEGDIDDMQQVEQHPHQYSPYADPDAVVSALPMYPFAPPHLAQTPPYTEESDPGQPPHAPLGGSDGGACGSDDAPPPYSTMESGTARYVASRSGDGESDPPPPYTEHAADPYASSTGQGVPQHGGAYVAISSGYNSGYAGAPAHVAHAPAYAYGGVPMTMVDAAALQQAQIQQQLQQIEMQRKALEALQQQYQQQQPQQQQQPPQ